jgi:hypothetical protein
MPTAHGSPMLLSYAFDFIGFFSLKKLLFLLARLVKYLMYACRIERGKEKRRTQAILLFCFLQYTYCSLDTVPFS